MVEHEQYVVYGDGEPSRKRLGWTAAYERVAGGHAGWGGDRHLYAAMQRRWRDGVELYVCDGERGSAAIVDKLGGAAWRDGGNGLFQEGCPLHGGYIRMQMLSIHRLPPSYLRIHHGRVGWYGPVYVEPRKWHLFAARAQFKRKHDHRDTHRTR